ISKPDQEGNQPERPRTAFPIVDSTEPHDEANAYHGPHNSAAHIRPLTPGTRGWCKQFRGNRLTFLHQHPDSALPATAYQKSEHAYHDHDQDRCTEYR